MLSVQVEISKGRIIGHYGVVEHQVYKLPDCMLLYYVKLSGGFDLFLTSLPTEQIGVDYYRQKYTIFDKQFSVCHTGSLSLHFSYRADGLIDVSVSNDGSIWTLGYFEFLSDGRVKWKGNVISDSGVRLLYSKALLLAK